jgi:4-amino-4-deoxy-L-arabinose transferase-like glycosyltransferase
MSKKKQPAPQKASNPNKANTINSNSSLFDRLNGHFEKRSRAYLIFFLLANFLFAMLTFDMKISISHDDALYLEAGYNYAQDFFGYYYTANAPLYPILLGVLMKIVGFKLFIMKFFSVIFMVLNTLFFYLAFKNRIPNVLLFFVLLLTIATKSLLTYASLTFTEAFYMFLQALFMFILFKVIDRVENDGEDIKHNWKSFLGLGLMLFVLALAKNIAIVAVGGVVLFFVLHKKFKSALYAVVSFVLFYASFAVAKTILWGEKAAGQSSAQMANLLYKDAYDVNKGKETLSGFFDRFWFNTENYLSIKFFDALGLRPDDAQMDTGLTWILIVLLLAGIVSVFRTKNKAMQAAAIYTVTMIGFTCLILHTSWQQMRYIMIFVPVMLLIIFYNIYHFFNRPSFAFTQFMFVFIFVIIGFAGISKTFSIIPKNTKVLRHNLKGEKFYGYTDDWINYLQMSEYAAESLPKDAVIACRKAPMSFVYGKGRKFLGVYKVPAADADSNLAYLKERNVKYAIVASIRAQPKVNNGNIVNTMQRILGPVQQKYPEKLKLLKQIGEVEPAYLFEINY